MEGLVDTKKDYIEHLQELISVPISEKIYSIYMSCSENNSGLKGFQKELNNIPKWNNHLIECEANNIVKSINCNYLYKLIKIIIVTSIKIKIYEYNTDIKNINYNVPSLQDFIHKCYINSSIFFWKNSYLFSRSNLKPAEIQHNLNIIELNVKKIIKNTIKDSINNYNIIEQLENLIEKSEKKNKVNINYLLPRKKNNKLKVVNEDDNKDDDKEEDDKEEDDKEEDKDDDVVDDDKEEDYKEEDDDNKDDDKEEDDVVDDKEEDDNNKDDDVEDDKEDDDDVEDDKEDDDDVEDDKEDDDDDVVDDKEEDDNNKDDVVDDKEDDDDDVVDDKEDDEDDDVKYSDNNDTSSNDDENNYDDNNYDELRTDDNNEEDANIKKVYITKNASFF